MHIVYWAHSYRDEDAPLNRHFGILIEEAQRMIINFDPPSARVNESKLDQNLRGCDGLVAVLSWRETGPSPFILHEIGLCLRARKPLLVFVDDRLSGNVLPARVLQRRYSHRTYFRQVREHTHALSAIKGYMGDRPPSRYQPNAGQRSCGMVGLGTLAPLDRKKVLEFVAGRGYEAVDLERIDSAVPPDYERYEQLANLDVALLFVDSRSRRSLYWTGAVSAAAIPCIAITLVADYSYSKEFPKEFQPRIANVGAASPIEVVLADEFDLYEQDFLKAEDAATIERYIRMQMQTGSLRGRYEEKTRDKFVEVVMGDKYTVSGQAGAVGRQAHAHDMTFTQTWNQLERSVDLAVLAQELTKLREALGKEATTPEHRFAIGAVEAAEHSARQKDGPKTLEYLKTAGAWSLSIAEKLGIGVATEVLKVAIGV